MEKLKLEHLAPYLPYAIKYANTKNENIYTMRSLSSEIDMVDFGWGDAMDFTEVKPILRPLHELDCDGEVNTPEHLEGCCYSYITYLLEKHFDIFGLIDKELAININTLDNV